ncbi:MAG TPA: S8 family peptidase [Burkholderiaceae bacterium]|nr:S8 family peptidase [Burkholderiaceae bacterium]
MNAPVPTGNQEFTTQIIVKYRDAATATVMDAGTMSMATTTASRRGLGLQHVRKLAHGAQVFRLNNRVTRDEADALAREIQANDPNVEYAEADGRLHALLTPNDTSYASQQWDLFESTAGINMPAAWDKATGSGVVVAVIDTGARPHADLVANLVPGFDFISSAATAGDGNGRDADGSDPGDFNAAGECGPGSRASNSSWHGTHVAGTIAAVTNNATGVAGIAFNAKVQPVRVLGKCGGSIADITDAIVWASGGTVAGAPANPTPARVINMSLGGGGACSRTEQAAINSARSRGTVVVVAAGNEAQDVANSSPANCAGVIAVAATGRTGKRASYSNFGTGVDLAAPGGDGRDGVLSTVNAGKTVPAGDAFAQFQGTSRATPHVAAVAALMLSVNSALTPDQVEARLKSSARKFAAGDCNQCGAGLLDANAAVNAALGGATPPPPPAVTEIAEVEPNDTRATAQVISANPARVSGSLAVGGVDLFRLTVAPGRSLTAKLTPSATANFDVAIFNANGNLITRSANTGNGAVDQVRVTNNGNANATVFVRANSISVAPGTANQQTYKLDLTQQ